MSMNWGSDGVDWRDESLDAAMAGDWLRASHEPNFEASDVFYRVLELTQSDLDPSRAWRLVKELFRQANADKELWQIGSEALSTIVQYHPDIVGDELGHLIRTDPKYRRALDGQISRELSDLRDRYGS
jgi:hypothetical protein